MPICRGCQDKVPASLSRLESVICPCRPTSYIGTFTPYEDPGCSTILESDSYHGFSDGIVRAADNDSAVATCIQHGPADNYIAAPWIYDAPNIWFCSPHNQDDFDSTEETRVPAIVSVPVGKKSDGTIAYETTSERDNLPLTGLKLSTFDGFASGIQFRRLDAWGIGIQEVLDMGFLDAVDVWSNTGSGYEVCFPQKGRIVLLDAATSPRTVVHIDYEIRDDYTCAAEDRAGTMVLADSPVATTRDTLRLGTVDAVSSAIALDNCQVILRYNLRLRTAPWGKILDVVPKDTKMTATARTRSWFEVNYLEQEGWNAAWLSDSEGDCDWTKDGNDTLALPAA